ncbi:MAG: hypothetical protein JWM77_2730 [Rhodospirillales bacterium]|jgi:hypothetical protein|nr:hypothetical protein [Rhodospirillales bacterium]
MSDRPGLRDLDLYGVDDETVLLVAMTYRALCGRTNPQEITYGRAVETFRRLRPELAHDAQALTPKIIVAIRSTPRASR